MTLNNAKKGLKILLISEALQLCATYLLAVIMLVIGSEYLGVVFYGLYILSMALQVVGLVIAAKDVEGFHNALKVTIVMIVAHTIVVFLVAFGLMPQTGATSFVIVLFDVMAQFFVIKSIRDIYESKNCKLKFLNIATGVIVVSGAFGIITCLWRETMNMLTSYYPVIGIISVLVSVAMVFISYVFYFVVLSNGIRVCSKE